MLRGHDGTPAVILAKLRLLKLRFDRCGRIYVNFSTFSILKVLKNILTPIPAPVYKWTQFCAPSDVGGTLFFVQRLPIVVVRSLAYRETEWTR